ncbi:MAG: efflux RND transporter periplasmic adaptor subunit [Deltaproteobacteria bacterium]|jgi:Cu(I)/Ag(I) efflux system membrane fusion protein|nr:efflux RND transporter periplasmic adaptor subunit [Deltaproteobacteria bacterium]
MKKFWKNLCLRSRLKSSRKFFYKNYPLFIFIFFIYVGYSLLPAGASTPHSSSTTQAHNHQTGSSNQNSQAKNTQTKSTVWTCSMHPQIRKNKPGKCPICGMDLIKVESKQTDNQSDWKLEMGERARNLADLQVEKVKKIKLGNSLAVTGEVKYNRENIKTISAWTAGRIEKLWVRFEGQELKRYQLLLALYSPQLYSTQLEYLKIAQLSSKTKGMAFGSGKDSLNAIESKLKLLGFPPQQLKQLKKEGKARKNVYVYSPYKKGTVIKKHIKEGDYVKTGAPLLEVADLSSMWVFFDLYERDVHFASKGQKIDFKVQSYPEKKFSGKVDYIDPYLDRKSRTVRARATLDNKNRLLKDGMYVRGFIQRGETKERTYISVPASGVLFTGKRSVVYVELSKGVYEGRLVELGHRVGDRYLILSGLKENEKVITNGNFKIDSALQIQAKHSMMSKPAKGKINKSKPHNWLDFKKVKTKPGFQKQLGKVVKEYFAVQEGLEQDNLAKVVQAAPKISKAANQVKSSPENWKKLKKIIITRSNKIQNSKELSVARDHFYYLSQSLIEAVKAYKIKLDSSVFIQFCPMARDNTGGYWLQNTRRIANPYFGASMHRCGETIISVQEKKGE